MKKEFKVGDRVAIYLNFVDRATATVHEVKGDEIDVIWYGEDQVTRSYHRKQCRRLVKKKRRCPHCRLELS